MTHRILGVFLSNIHSSNTIFEIFLKISEKVEIFLIEKRRS